SHRWTHESADCPCRRWCSAKLTWSTYGRVAADATARRSRISGLRPPRTFDREANEWKDGEALFLTCSVWHQAADNAAGSLARGVRVIVQGRLKQRSHKDRKGVKRTVVELDADGV